MFNYIRVKSLGCSWRTIEGILRLGSLMMRRVSHPLPPAGMIDSKVLRDSTRMYRWRMKDVVGRFSPIRPKLGLKGSLKRRRKDEGEETRGRIREVLSKIGLESVAQNEMSQVLSMEALEDSVLNLTHTRTSNRSMKKNHKKQIQEKLMKLWKQWNNPIAINSFQEQL